jgi:tetratricopeptide (TPR) repeat protein
LSIVSTILLLAAASTFEEAYRAGLEALQQNRLTDAQGSLENATKLRPESSGAWLALAQTYRKLQQPGKADEMADRAARLAGNDARLLRVLVTFYSEGGAFQKAADAQAKYAAASPGDREAAVKGIQLYLDAHDPQRAIAMGKGTPGWEQRADIRRLLGRAYAAVNQMSLSDEEYQAAVRLNPYDESYVFDFAQSLLRREKFEPAISLLLAAKKTFDKSAQIELTLGVGYYGLRRYPDAAAAFERTIALAPDIEQPYVFLAKMLDQIPEKAPDLTRVFAGYEKAHPQNWAAYFIHAQGLVAQSQDPRTAEALLNRAIALNAQAAEPHYVLGVLQQRERRFEDAASEFDKAAKLNPDDAATFYHLAQVYDRLGKRDRAEAARARHAQLLSVVRQ